MFKTKRPIDWPTSLFLILTPLLSLIFIPLHIAHFNVPLWTLPLTLVFIAISGMSITTGYHRMLAHRSFETRLWLKRFFVMLAAGAWQGTALKWCTDHRRHHRMIDTDNDPYSAKKGFFYSHIGWLFLREPEHDGKFDQDLLNDPWIRFQSKYYVPIAIFMSFGPPTLVGWMLGDALSGFLYGGLLKVVLAHHFTFLVNSAAHFWGSRPYSTKISARDNFFVSVLTHGEGYHNFHHVFEGDYRNGIRWYHWDPTKWLIQVFAKMGLVTRLNRIPDSVILRAKLQTVKDRLEQKGLLDDRLVQLYRNIDKAQARWRELKLEYARGKKNFEATQRARLAHMKMEIRLARREFRHNLDQWTIMVRALEATLQRNAIKN